MSRAELIGLVLLTACCGGGSEDRDGGASADGGEACPADVPPTCYTGEPATEGVGICHAGVPRCEQGEVVDCIGAVYPEAEWCSARDDDCDGEVDEDVCRYACIGLECERPWGEPPTDFIQGPNGGIALELAADDAVAVLWVPERNSGTVAKVDTRERRVVARYQVIPAADGCAKNAEFVFSIAVDPAGNVYLGTASFDLTSSTHRLVSVAYADCPDRDGDGVVETSTDPEDVLPFLEDECVRWHAPFEAPPTYRTTGLAVERHARRTGRDWLVWASSAGHGRIWAVDPDTGEDTGDELVLDGRSANWFIDFDGRGVLFTDGDRDEWRVNTLAAIDTQTLSFQRVQTVVFDCIPGAMIQDHRGRIWSNPCLAGYDSGADEWLVPSFYGRETGKYVFQPHGFVTAPSGVVVGNCWFDMVGDFLGHASLFTYDIEADEGEVLSDTPSPPSVFALDRDGQIWQIEEHPRGDSIVDCAAARQSSSAWVLDPRTLEAEPAIDGELWGSVYFADNPTGVVPLDVLPGPRSTVWQFSGCDPASEGETLWGSLDWTASDVDETHIRFEVQAGDDPTWSAEGPWLVAGQDPEDDGPVPLRELVPEPHPILHVRTTLWGDQLSPPYHTPELLRIEAGYDCPGDVD